VKQRLELILMWYFKDLEFDDPLEFNLEVPSAQEALLLHASLHMTLA